MGIFTNKKGKARQNGSDNPLDKTIPANEEAGASLRKEVTGEKPKVNESESGLSPAVLSEEGVLVGLGDETVCKNCKKPFKMAELVVQGRLDDSHDEENNPTMKVTLSSHCRFCDAVLNDVGTFMPACIPDGSDRVTRSTLQNAYQSRLK